MNRFLKAFFILVVVLSTCFHTYGEGSTPVSSLKLTGNADGGLNAFTNLNMVSCTTAMVSWISLGTNIPISDWAGVVVAGGGLTNGSTGVDFGSLSVDTSASNGTEVVNWQTMTNAIATLAPIPTGMPFLSSNNVFTGSSNVFTGFVYVNSNATFGTQVVNYESMTGYVGSVASASLISNWNAAYTWSTNDPFQDTNTFNTMIAQYPTNDWNAAYVASTNVAVISGTAPGFIFADASTNLSYLMALTNGASGVNFGSLTVNGNPVLTNAPADTDTLQTVIDRGGIFVASSTNVAFDSANARTNTYGGLLTILGQRVQEGAYTSATGSYSHAEGLDSKAFGLASHAEGSGFNIASGIAAHAEGGGATTASGDYSHGEGSGTIASGYASHSEGNSTRASGSGSHSEGYVYLGRIEALTNGAHAGGYTLTVADTNLASGLGSFAHGRNVQAIGDYSMAFGYNTIASGNYSVAFGQKSDASNHNSIVMSDGDAGHWYGSHGVNSLNFCYNGGIWGRTYKLVDENDLLYSGGNPVLTNVAPFFFAVGVDTTTWSPITNITFLPSNGIAIDTSVIGNKIDLTFYTTNLVSMSDFTNHVNNLDPDILHLTAAEKFIATNIVDWVDGSNTTVRTIGTSNIAVDVNIGTNGLFFSSDARIVYTTNNTIAIQYLNGGVWSNAMEALR